MVGGQGDYTASHDLEDIVAVLDGRPEVVDEIRQCESTLREHLQNCLAALLRESRFVEALPGHMPGDAASQARVPIIIKRLKAIAAT